MSLTKAGRALVATLRKSSIEQRQLVFDGLDESELDLLANALDRIDDNVRALLADDATP